MKSKQHVLILALMLSFTQFSFSQIKLSGIVTSSSGEPVPFAALSINRTQYNLIAKEDGSFEFKSLQAGDYSIRVRCLGYKEIIDSLTLTNDHVYSPVLQASSNQLDEVLVNSTRVEKQQGMAFSNMDAETIKKQNMGQDAPFILNQLPSVVVNSDAGNGVGYTGIRIRGSDASRVNVTINGVPVNDAESQGTYFVDMPDLVSSVNNIQVQRGVGASSNGAGAFGASINFQTSQLNEKSYANVISTAGSFNTLRTTLAAGTGLLSNKFTLDARASRITSNGYIDRASSNLQSYYLAAGYYGKKTMIRFINFLGQEKTYQAWNYVLEDSIKRGNRTYNPSGEYVDAQGITKYYSNETDNYKQNNFQLHGIHKLNSRLVINLTAHYTKGAGYYEQYKKNRRLTDYQMQNVITTKGDTITKTDLIRRLWLDNDFVGGIFNLNYTASSKLAFTLGGGYNSYFGKHYGRVMWARYASNTEINHQYYLTTTNKNDGNIYLKTNYKVNTKLNLFLDLQQRLVEYRYFGYTDDVNQTYMNQMYSFFNPKLGLSYDLNSKLNVYGSVSVGNKEPSGDDLTKNFPSTRPVSEHMTDVEMGGTYSFKKVRLACNLYNMHYYNQLVLNGQIDNVGNPKHVNVKDSYRRGVELELNATLNRYIFIAGNITLSQNKINQFVEYLDSSDVDYNYFEQHKNLYKKTDISYSPNCISSLAFVLKPIKKLDISVIHKTVSRQYLDNTANFKRSLKPYDVLDVRINYLIKTKSMSEINIMLGAYNVLSKHYETNGYTYSAYVGSDLSTQNWLAPAALIHFMGGVNIKF